MRTRHFFSSVALGMLLVCIPLASPVRAQGMTGQPVTTQPLPGQTAPAPIPPQQDPLARLRAALQDAGAPPLTADQETQLTTLINNFQSSLPQRQDTALQSARNDFENAVLSGDIAAANNAAAAVAAEIAKRVQARLQAGAQFAIQALNVLKTNDNQVGLLQQKFGTQGLLGLLKSMVGMGMHGRFGGPGGPGMMGRMWRR